MIATLLLIALLTFVLMHVVPGGPFTQEKQVPKSVLDALNEKYKLNDPLWKQFLDYMGGLLRFDLGDSFLYKIPVTQKIAMHMGTSFMIAAIATVFEFLIAIPLGF